LSKPKLIKSCRSEEEEEEEEEDEEEEEEEKKKLNTCPLDFPMQSNRSWCGTVGIVTRHRLYDPGFQFRQRQDIIFPFPKISNRL
jgi:hypothetical protein